MSSGKLRGFHFSSLYFAARGWILAAAYAALVWTRLRGDAPPQPWFLILVVAGIALRLWAGAHLGEHGNAARAEAPVLATTGPYAFSRNPLYLSNLAVAAGLIFFANPLSGAVAAGLLIFLFAHHDFLARWEEKRLRAIHGEAHAAYAARVPRWFSFRRPERPDPGDNAAHLPVSFRTAFARQGRNAGYAIACAVILWAAGR